MQKMVFDLVGGLPTPEMTKAYEQEHASANIPSVREAYHYGIPVDNSDHIVPDLLKDIINDIFGPMANVEVRRYGVDENGELVEM